MKVWNGYGSEHSMNLVMIGRFKEARDADKAKKLIDELIKQVNAERDFYRSDASPEKRRFSEEMLNLLMSSQLTSIGPMELEQFSYDVNIQVAGNEVVVTTDEVDVLAFLKVLLDKGARVEVYSAHDYSDTGYGRGE